MKQVAAKILKIGDHDKKETSNIKHSMNWTHRPSFFGCSYLSTDILD